MFSFLSFPFLPWSLLRTAKYSMQVHQGTRIRFEAGRLAIRFPVYAVSSTSNQSRAVPASRLAKPSSAANRLNGWRSAA